MNFNNFFDGNNRRIRMGRKIGSGGEGAVYEVREDPHSVAKIYFQPLNPKKQRKIKLMTLKSNDELRGISAWPTTSLHEGLKGPVCGFLMPKINGYEPIHKLYTPAQRKVYFPEADWNYLITAARNLSVAFAVMHKNGYVIGDVNQGNVLVNKEMHIKLIDCDSFQVSANNEHYLCEVGVPHFTPPELQKIPFHSVIRTPNHDNFGLAILCFHLLFLGRHPFSGKFTDLEEVPIERAIAEYRFVYGSDAAIKKMAPPPNSVDLSILPKRIGNMFELAFSEHGSKINRPSAIEWIHAIDNELRKLIKVCNFEKYHKFYSKLSFCPWCNLEQKIGIVLFLGKLNEEEFNLNYMWGRIVSVVPPDPTPKFVSNVKVKPTPIPLKIKNSIKFERYKHYITIFQFLPLYLISPSLLLIGFIFALIIELYPTNSKNEFEKRRSNLNLAQKEFSLVMDAWNNLASEELFISRFNQLKNIKGKYEVYQQHYEKELRDLKHNDRARQLESYLRKCFIDDYKIRGIGENRKATLRSYGIETAADIHPIKIYQIPGFGQKLAGELVYWKETMIKNFSYNPNIEIDKADIANLKLKYRKSMKPLEKQLISGYTELNLLKNNILVRRQRLLPEIERKATILAQAKADVAILK